METYNMKQYASTAAKEVITENNNDCLILCSDGTHQQDKIGNNVIQANVTIDKMIGAVNVSINATKEKNIVIKGPSFRTKDGYFIKSKDNKILSVQEG